MPKFIFVTGGVVSGIGKGIAAASIGHLLSHSYKVVPIKCDGYLNTDPGTMNPAEHGEVFVLSDGGEVDMDFGHYERFLDVACARNQSLTMGKVFSAIAHKERRGDYLGKTVQFIPHVTDYIQEQFFAAAGDADIAIVEIGGTIGDIENELYVEAARQMSYSLPASDTCFVHLTYVPFLDNVKEYKSKPTQQSVRQLLERGIRPDIIITRSNEPIEEQVRRKIAVFCNVSEHSVISGHDVPCVYSIPLSFESQGIVPLLEQKLQIKVELWQDEWPALIKRLLYPSRKVTVAICGKYTSLEDSYASVVEALHHCGANLDSDIDIRMVDTSDADPVGELAGVDAVIVPGGFGNRGIEGKIKVIQYCRENGIPFLGICLGLQLAVIEYARTVCGIADATSEEFDPATKQNIIAYLPGQRELEIKGGTMRLGSYQAVLNVGSRVAAVYGAVMVSERHRHRYEVNPAYHQLLRDNGLTLAGMSPDGTLVEFISLDAHPYFLATQAHPELQSKLERPAPLFLGLVKAALARKGHTSNEDFTAISRVSL